MTENLIENWWNRYTGSFSWNKCLNLMPLKQI